uniref:Uncharacterized protein LOC104225926 n=1 Tax=Nicotiana sylvestris TaxID=4096 RepID=A0A1U7WFS7_NICSY|nr:PREDICTED: uncharacterized protein LOC104225926 [Nicotiana sylvestris]
MIKLNCDGAFSSNNDAAGFGDAFRNSNGDWIVGFHKASQAISPTHAELMALLEGLKNAKEMNFLNLEIETNCTEVIKLIYEDSYNFSNIVSNCRWLMDQLKLPQLKHNLREGNEVTHMLAKEAIKSSPSTKCFYHACPSFFVEQEVIKNKHGACNSFKNISTTVCNYLATMGNNNALKISTMSM